MKRILLSFICAVSILLSSAQTNLISDPNFESADLTRVYTESDTNPASVNVWAKVVQSVWSEKDVKIEVENDLTRLKVAHMQLFGVGIPNASPFRAFIVQRVGTSAEPTLYTYSFWAKAIQGTPTVRIFVKLDAYTNQYFIFDTDKPTTPTGTYTAYAKNLTPTIEWTYFENDVDLFRKTTSRGAITYSQAIETTASERTNPAVCFQNNTANSTVQVDEVKFVKSVSTNLGKTKQEIKIYQEGKSIYVAKVEGEVILIDIAGRQIKSLVVKEGETGKLTVNYPGLYIVRNGKNSQKVVVK